MTRSLTHRDFRLEGYIFPQRFFFRWPRPLRLIDGSPNITCYEDVVYTPTTSMTRPLDGALYDNMGQRIAVADVRRGVRDRCISDEPRQFNGNRSALPCYDSPALYLGTISRHYGHFLTESLARWWAADATMPPVKHYLVHLANPQGLDIPVVAACLALAGLKREDIIFFSRPVRLREVWVPEVAFQEASHIYSAYRAMWTAFLGSVDIPESDTTDQPLFVSRRYVNKGTGRYLGEEKIEDYLTRKGVRVLYPEQLSFAEQIRVFNKHKRIIGTSGSGTHNIMLSRTPKSIVYLTPPEVHRNHFLIDACFEADSIFLQACRTGHAMRALTLRARAKIGLANPVVAASMWRMRLLNHARIIEWFESSGYL